MLTIKGLYLVLALLKRLSLFLLYKVIYKFHMFIGQLFEPDPMEKDVPGTFELVMTYY